MIYQIQKSMIGRLIKKTISIGIFILFFVIGSLGADSVKAASSAYSVVLSFDKGSVKAGDDLQLAISAKNTGNPINNFEIRIPYYKSINDASVSTENPSFNKILDSSDYPVGYNSRSWIINSFDAGESKEYSVKYKISSDPKTPNGLVSNVTLPTSWKDPNGLNSGTPVSFQTFRADIYINNVYKNSFEVNLPKLAALDNPISQVKLSDVYYFAGSKSTNLKDITSSNIKAFPNFKLETQDVLVEWLVPIDFSGAGVVDKLKNLDASFKLGWGKLDFNSDQLDFLNKSVKVTFKNVKLVTEPKIRVKTESTALKDSKATWQPTANTITVTPTTLVNLALVPNIETDKSIIETENINVKITGKVSDPNAQVSYSIDNAQPKELLGIDLTTGAFEIDVENADKVRQVEIISKFKNGESDSKIVIVKYKEESPPVGTIATTPAPQNTSLLLNPITLALILAALGITSLIGGYIYYLYYRKNKLKKLKANTDIASAVNPPDPGLSKTDPILNPNESLEKPLASPVDLDSLKDEYLLKKGHGEEEKSFLGKD